MRSPRTSEVGQLREGLQRAMGACLQMDDHHLCQRLQAPSGQQLRDRKGDVRPAATGGGEPWSPQCNLPLLML